MSKEEFKPFEFLEHTADVLIVARGRTIEELFENAAKAVFEVMTDTSKVEPKEKRVINVDGWDLENLLYRWIEELLIAYDSENMLFSKFKVYSIKKNGEEEYSLEGEAWGERFDEQRHERRTIVKAVTYAQMKITKKDGLWEASFVVDI